VVVVVLQPRKPERGHDGPPSAHDSRWTNDVLADVHTMVVLHRWTCMDAVRDAGPLEAETLVRVERSRDTAGGDTLLVLDAPMAMFREGTAQEHEAFVRRRGGKP
jgi:hypothetical protein